MPRILAIIGLASLVLTLPAQGRDQQKELAVDLKYTPQESVHSATADLPADALREPLLIKIEDVRTLSDPLIIGEGTNDDDKKFAILATTDPVAFFGDALKSISAAWGVKADPASRRVLTVQLSRFDVEESNKAVGSMYAAEVKVAYRLSSGGRDLAHGAVSGSAHRYGRARSAPNCAEVLSDATKEATAALFAETALQQAWASGKPAGSATTSAAPAAKETVEERLRKLDDLLKKGLITKPEYDKKRAEILKDL